MAAYGFSEGTGSTTADASGNGLTGTLNSTTWSTSGKYGKALVFNGTTSYVDLGNPTSMRLTSSATLSAWVYPTGNPGSNGQIVAKTDIFGVGWQLRTAPNEVGVRNFCVVVANGIDEVKRCSTTVLSLNTWYFVAGVYNATGQTLAIYVNGVLDNGALTGSVPTVQTNSTVNVNIGRSAGGYYFIGTIDEVRVYNRALAQAEIQNDMSSPVSGSAGTSACDLAAPLGTIDAADVQAAVNMSLGLLPCTANIGGSGVCNVAMVQRVVNAMPPPNGTSNCVTGPGTIPHDVTLTWSPSTSPNVTGYNVYRSTTSGGLYSKLNASLVAGLTYTDSSVQAGLMYYYVLTTVNNAGAESGYSTQAEANVPTP